MPEFHFDFVVSGLNETQVGQLMVGIIEVVGICGGSMIEESRRSELAGQPGARPTLQADRSARLPSAYGPI
jgi:hypothetical protein